MQWIDTGFCFAQRHSKRGTIAPKTRGNRLSLALKVPGMPRVRVLSISKRDGSLRAFRTQRFQTRSLLISKKQGSRKRRLLRELMSIVLWLAYVLWSQVESDIPVGLALQARLGSRAARR